MTIEALEPETTLPAIDPLSYGLAVSAASRSLYTLFDTPPHDKLHQVVEDSAIGGPHQPMQPEIEKTAIALEEKVLPQANLALPNPIEGPRLIALGGMLVQFADYIPEFQEKVHIDYPKMSGLRNAVAEQAAQSGPLGFAEQLETSLAYNDGDVVESFCRFSTSRKMA